MQSAAYGNPLLQRGKNYGIEKEILIVLSRYTCCTTVQLNGAFYFVPKINEFVCLFFPLLIIVILVLFKKISQTNCLFFTQILDYDNQRKFRMPVNISKIRCPFRMPNNLGGSFDVTLTMLSAVMLMRGTKTWRFQHSNGNYYFTEWSCFNKKVWENFSDWIWWGLRSMALRRWITFYNVIYMVKLSYLYLLSLWRPLLSFSSARSSSQFVYKTFNMERRPTFIYLQILVEKSMWMHMIYIILVN